MPVYKRKLGDVVCEGSKLKSFVVLNRCVVKRKENEISW